jgi:hypothetical protein
VLRSGRSQLLVLKCQCAFLHKDCVVLIGCPRSVGGIELSHLVHEPRVSRFADRASCTSFTMSSIRELVGLTMSAITLALAAARRPVQSACIKHADKHPEATRPTEASDQALLHRISTDCKNDGIVFVAAMPARIAGGPPVAKITAA